jgi:hypothetical protein
LLQVLQVFLFLIYFVLLQFGFSVFLFAPIMLQFSCNLTCYFFNNLCSYLLFNFKFSITSVFFFFYNQSLNFYFYFLLSIYWKWCH